MKKSLLLVTMILWAASAHAATWYVDSSVASSGNGQSWATAWKNISNITGLSAGDTVYISGGPSGASQTYTMSSSWSPAGGTAGNPITYKIGQDSLHNGTAYFSGSGVWLTTSTASNYIISGDAGDGKRHFTIANPSTGISGYDFVLDLSSGTKSNVRISYVNFGKVSVPGSRLKMMDVRGITGFELDHTYTMLSGPDPDCWLYYESLGSGYDANRIHHNEVYMPHDPSSGTGPDGIKGGHATSIYNNLFAGYDPGGFAGSQHQDAIQALAGSYIKIYNNKFVNMTNYGIFLQAFYGDFSHVRIYNNQLVLTNPTIQASAPPQGIVVGQNQAGHDNLGRWAVFTDVVVANNTVADYGATHSCGGLGGTAGPVYTNCTLANNICWKGGWFAAGEGVTQVDNITSSSGIHFASYSNLSPSNDFHLLSSDTTFKDQGTSMASYFTTDKDGVSRPQGSAWDMGAYESLTGGGLQRPMPPSSLLIY